MPNLGYAWVAEGQIPRNAKDYKKHKVLMGQICNDNYRVMDIPYYAGNNSCCSQSYIPIFSPNNTKEECLNICKYIRTRFFRYLISALKIGQNIGNRVYKLVPTQDFSSNSDIDWSQSVYNIERQLYKKYNLSQEEIDYIEKVIKFMVNLTNTDWVEFYTDKYIEEHNLKKYKLMNSNSINEVHRILDVIRQNEYNTGKNDTSIIVISGLPVEEIREILESLQNGPYIARLQIVNQRFSDILEKNHYIKLDGETKITDNI